MGFDDAGLYDHQRVITTRWLLFPLPVDDTGP
jgi:hypothetical protein